MEAAASPGYGIELIEGKGRALIARRSYEVGETLFTESPLVAAQFSWNKLYGYTACDHCLRPLESLEENLTRLLKQRPDSLLAALPDQDRLSGTDKSTHVACPNGCGAKYCRPECRDEAAEMYHRLLCFTTSDNVTNPVLRIDGIWRPMHYPPETTTIMLVLRLMAILKSTGDTPYKKALLEALSSLKADTIDPKNGLMHRILRDDFQSQLQQLSVVLSTYLFLLPEANPTMVSVEWLTKVFALIGLNAQGVGGSPFNQYVTNYQKETQGAANGNAAEASSPTDLAIDELYQLLDAEVGLEFTNSEGSALYALESACNHSCDPNAKIEFPFNNAVIALVAKKPIEAGQEVTISYMDECSLSRSRHSRRRALMENYLFACECPKCIKELLEGQPDVTSSEDEEEEDEEENMEE